MKKKINAFTLIETIVVLTISTIIIGSAYLFITQTNIIFKIKRKNMESQMDILLFHNTIKNDVFSSDKIIHKNELIYFLFKEKEISYDFNARNYIIRKTRTTYDTFNITHTLPKIQSDINKISNINFQILSNSDSLNLKYFKEYNLNER